MRQMLHGARDLDAEKTNHESMYEYFACPRCLHDLEQPPREGHGGSAERAGMQCRGCGTRFALQDHIPVLIDPSDSDQSEEGIAVDLENAIALFRKEIDPEDRTAGRLFDQDLGNIDDTFLDVGCGIGRHLLVLRQNGIRNMLGFDLVPELIRIAREEYGLTNVFVANALHIPLRSETVDRCLLYNAIEHCSDPQTVLEHIHRVLKPGGVLYMDVPNARSMGDRIFRWGGIVFYGKTSHIQTFTRRKIAMLVQKIGFRIAVCREHRGIFIDYPQLERYSLVRTILKRLFRNEVNAWELKLIKET